MPEHGHRRHGSRAWWHGLALAGVGGVAWQLQQAQLYSGAVYAGALCLAGLALWGLMRASGHWRWWALPILALVCWGWSGWLAVQRWSTLPPALAGRDFDVQGVVAAMPQRGAQAQRFVLSLEQITLVPKPGGASLPADFVSPELLSLSWYPGRMSAECRQRKRQSRR